MTSVQERPLVNKLMILNAVAAHSYLGDGLGASPPEIANFVKSVYSLFPDSRFYAALESSMDEAVCTGIIKQSDFQCRFHLTDKGLKWWNERVRPMVTRPPFPPRDLRSENGGTECESSGEHGTLGDILDSLMDYFRSQGSS